MSIRQDTYTEKEGNEMNKIKEKKSIVDYDRILRPGGDWAIKILLEPYWSVNQANRCMVHLQTRGNLVSLENMDTQVAIKFAKGFYVGVQAAMDLLEDIYDEEKTK